MKKLLTAVALAALVSSPALARTYHSQHAATSAGAYSAYAAAPGYMSVNPNAVIFNGQVVGADPDPNVRLELMKEAATVNNG